MKSFREVVGVVAIAYWNKVLLDLKDGHVKSILDINKLKKEWSSWDRSGTDPRIVRAAKELYDEALLTAYRQLEMLERIEMADIIVWLEKKLKGKKYLKVEIDGLFSQGAIDHRYAIYRRIKRYLFAYFEYEFNVHEKGSYVYFSRKSKF